jgi:hypothetical protein
MPRVRVLMQFDYDIPPLERPPKNGRSVSFTGCLFVIVILATALLFLAAWLSRNETMLIFTGAALLFVVLLFLGFIAFAAIVK